MQVPVLKQIIDHYGASAQLSKTVEELSELIIELAKTQGSKFDEVNVEPIIEEIADVEIMIGHLKLIFDINEASLLKVKKFKINRTLEEIRMNS